MSILNPDDQGQNPTQPPGGTADQPASQGEPAVPASGVAVPGEPAPSQPAEGQKCVTCGNAASGGTCMACGQGEVSCSCPSQSPPGGQGGVGGGPMPGGEQPTGVPPAV